MKRPKSSIYHIFIFVLAQIAWLLVLGIWLYWNLSHYITSGNADDGSSSRIISEGWNIFVLIIGLVLLVAVSVLMSLQFHRLRVQFNLARLYDNFIANVTHELKSPLASIQLSLETMHLHDLEKTRQRQFISMMLKDSSRLNRLINAILEIPALEQKKIAHNYHVYTIGPLIQELVRDASEQFKLSQETVTIRGKGECRCVVDRNALRIVFDNLIDNSVKYSAGSLKISIFMYCGSQHFKLDYNDQGIGISAKDQKKVFDKFYRIQNYQSPNVKGTGLGLYWTREIIRYHGGKISVNSKGRNKGATFHIELPIYQAANNRYIQKLLKIAQKRRHPEETIDE